MGYKYGELRKYIDENKNYKIEFFSKLISDIIMLAGVSFMLKSTDNWNNESFTYFLIWYLLQTVLFELVKSIEFEIKSDGLINMISSRTSITMIYFKRSIVWLVKAAILFSIVIFLSGNGLNGIIQFKPKSRIIYWIYHYSVFDIWLQTHNNTRNQKNNCGKSSRYEKNCVEFDTFICSVLSFYEKSKDEITI